MSVSTESHVPVVIIGGGPAGLCASILLSRHGIRSLLFDRKPGTADHPRAGYHNLRTMELFRQWGIEDRIRDNGFPVEEQNEIFWTTRLFGGTELGRLTGGGDADAQRHQREVSPTMPGFCSQDACEPILLDLANRSSLADIRFGHHVTDLDLVDDGAVVTFVDSNDTTGTVHARYVIAADGAHGMAARSVGLVYEGGEILGHMMNVQFLAPGVRERLGGERRGFMYCIFNRDISGVWGTLDRTDRWVLNFFADGERRPDVARDFPHERCRDLIRAAAGDPDLDVQILTVNPWAMSARIAESYRVGPVFFAGDAAHLFPPTGGFGMNTAVQDVHNLAWKLAYVLQGSAEPSLLDTYDTERRQVGRANMEQSVLNAMRMAESGAAFDPGRLALLDDPVAGAALRADIAAAIQLQREEFETLGQTLGFSYDSAAVLDDGTAPDVLDNPIRDYRPTARPGARAPHAWVSVDGTTISTLDLFDVDHVLLVGDAHSPWCVDARELGVRHVRPSRPDGHEGNWLDVYGITDSGAVLVRPDGHVAWRCPRYDAGASSLHHVVARLGLRPNSNDRPHQNGRTA